MVNGYSGSKEARENGRVRVGCWGHVRRKFFEALSSSEEEATHALSYIRALYRVEQQAAEDDVLGTAAHLARRQARSRPRVDERLTWARKQQDLHPPKGPLGSALGYLLHQEQALRRFLDDPKGPLDNNVAEHALRIIALGRKNFLFAGHDEAAQNFAVVHSLVSTCQLHGVNPRAYIADVLVRAQTPGITPDDRMPWNWTAPAPAPAPT